MSIATSREADNGKEFVADLDQGCDGSVEETEAVGLKTAGGGRVQELTNSDTDGFVDVRGFKTPIGFNPIGVINVADLVEEGFRYNQDRFGIDKSGRRKNEGFPGDEGETGGAKLLNTWELLIIDFSDGAFKANAATLNIRMSNRDDDGLLDGQLLTLTRNGNSDSFTVVAAQAFGSNGDGTVVVSSLGNATAIGIVLEEGEAAQIGVSVEGVLGIGNSPQARMPDRIKP